MQKGYICVLTNTHNTGNVKIGKTTKHPIQRAAELSSTGVIGRFEVYYAVECGDIDHAEALSIRH
jgi:T5orf172 domain